MHYHSSTGTELVLTFPTGLTLSLRFALHQIIRQRGQRKSQMSNLFYVWWQASASMGFLRGTSGKEPYCQCKRHKRCGFDPWDGKIPRRRSWQPTLVFLPGESLGQRKEEVLQFPTLFLWVSKLKHCRKDYALFILLELHNEQNFTENFALVSGQQPILII